MLAILAAVALFGAEIKSTSSQDLVPSSLSHPYFGDLSFGIDNFLHGSAGIGLANVSFNIYNQLLFQYNLNWSKLDIWLGFTFNFREGWAWDRRNWNTPREIIATLTHLKWDTSRILLDRSTGMPLLFPPPPIHLKIGRFHNYSLGWGHVISHYTNTALEPIVNKRGGRIDVQWGSGFGGQIFVNDIVDWGLFGTRIFIMPMRLFSQIREHADKKEGHTRWWLGPLSHLQIGGFYAHDRISDLVDALAWEDRRYENNPTIGDVYVYSGNAKVVHRRLENQHTVSDVRAGPPYPQEAPSWQTSNTPEKFFWHWGIDIDIPLLEMRWLTFRANAAYVHQNQRARGMHIGAHGSLFPWPFSIGYRADFSFSLGDRNTTNVYIPRFHGPIYDGQKGWLSVWQRGLSNWLRADPSRERPWVWYIDIYKVLWGKKAGRFRFGAIFEKWMGLPVSEDNSEQEAFQNTYTQLNAFRAGALGHPHQMGMRFSTYIEIDNIVSGLLLRLFYDKYNIDEFGDLLTEYATDTRIRVEFGYRFSEFVQVFFSYHKGFVYDMAAFDRLCQEPFPLCNTNEPGSSTKNIGSVDRNVLPVLTPSKNQSLTLETRLTF